MKNIRKIALIGLLILSVVLIGYGIISFFSKNTASSALSEEPGGERIDESSQVEEKTLFIGPKQVDCVGEGPRLCYQVKENPEDDWLFFYNQIDGFTWKEGYIYELRVAIHHVQSPPAGGSSLQYELIEVISKEEVVPDQAAQYIEITSPADGDALDASQPIVVTGMGAGLFEGNVVVQVADKDGNILIQEPTVQQAEEVGGEGPWSIELRLGEAATNEGIITAFSPSPKDGSWAVSDSVTVKFAQPLTDTPWILSEFAQEDLNSLLAVYAATINFSTEDSRASGNAGCNGFFATYQTDGDQLTLGPAGSTLMMCPEPQMKIEMAFLKALEEIAGYQIEGDKLILSNAADEMRLTFRVDPFSTATNFTKQELSNAIYMCQHADVCTVELSNGQYQEPITGSASRLSVVLSNYAAFGDLDGDGIEEAVVILVSNTGGTSTFYDLAVVKKYEGDLINTAITLLGDRVVIKSLTIEDGVVVVAMKVPSGDHITCCPDAPVEKRYRLEGGELILEE